MAKVTDEQIIAALLSKGSVKAAAADVGLSERSIYDRMNTREFKVLYRETRADIVRATVATINGKLEEALETVSAIMSNEEVNPATRLQAAQTIINTAAKFSDHLDRSESKVESERFML